MIDQGVKTFLKYDFEQRFQEQFYGELFEYFRYILPILKKGNHTAKKPMECVGSQYLHLYYMQKKDSNSTFVVYKNEQGPDTIFEVFLSEKMDYSNITVSIGNNSFNQEIKKLKKKSKITFQSKEELLKFVRYNLDSFTKDVATTNEIINGKKKNIVFELMHSKGKNVIFNNYKYDFQDQLRIFDLMNCMVSGISSNMRQAVPNKFIKTMYKVDKFLEKLKKRLPPSINE